VDTLENVHARCISVAAAALSYSALGLQHLALGISGITDQHFSHSQSSSVGLMIPALVGVPLPYSLHAVGEQQFHEENGSESNRHIFPSITDLPLKKNNVPLIRPKTFKASLSVTVRSHCALPWISGPPGSGFYLLRMWTRRAVRSGNLANQRN